MISSEDHAGIVEHMNSDHADAVLLYARVFGNRPDAHAATLTEITSTSMQLIVSIGSRSESIIVAFDEPVQTSGDARRVLIKMARLARKTEETF